jgi:hypothetical protein
MIASGISISGVPETSVLPVKQSVMLVLEALDFVTVTVLQAIVFLPGRVHAITRIVHVLPCSLLDVKEPVSFGIPWHIVNLLDCRRYGYLNAFGVKQNYVILM